MAVKEKLIDLLSQDGYPVFLQGSLNEKAKYPETFITFYNFDTPKNMFYDNKNKQNIWYFWVYLYSTDPDTVNSKIDFLQERLEDNGFNVQGNSIDVASDEETHTGRMFTCYYVENKN